MAELSGDLYAHISESMGAKKWISAVAVADLGNSQAALVSPTRFSFKAFQLGPGQLVNRSGSTATVAFGVRYRASSWAAGTITAAGVYTDDTTDIQNVTANDVTLANRTDSGSGLLISADEKFNALDFIVSTAGDPTVPVTILEFWDGTQWVDIASSCFVNDALVAAAAGEKLILFPEPPEWVKGGSGTNVSQTRYNLRVRTTVTGGGATNPLLAQLFIGYSKLIIDGLATGGQVAIVRDNPLLFPRSGDALFPLCSVASRSNYMEVGVQFYA